MYTQNTPIHVKLWHRDFWLLATANLLITVAMYMQFIVLPQWMLETAVSSGWTAFYTSASIAVALGIFGLGIFSLGCFCSFWIQRYRRNLVCIRAMLVMALCFCALYCLYGVEKLDTQSVFVLIFIIRFIQGTAFGIAHTVLAGTLIIDTCESFQRTEANHVSAWFVRFALSLGPALAVVLLSLSTINVALIVGVILCLLSMSCVFFVRFPFKAPEDTLCKVSLDRFFLPQGKWLFINFAMIAAVVGMVLSLEHTLTFYGMIMAGFFLALLSQRFVFVNADLKSEITAGIILIIISILLNFSGKNDSVFLLYPMLLGCGIGIIGARFLLFFIKLRGHCQRSTSQSTYFLSWEFGLSLGLFLGYGCTDGGKIPLFVFAIFLSCLALILYLSFTHNWYIKNKNR